MLQKFHEKIVGWIASVIIGVLCLAFVLWGIQYYVGQPSEKGKEVAKVDGVKITENQVNRAYQQMQRQVTSRGGTLNPQMNASLKAIALEKIINELVLTKAATKEGFVISQNQVKQLIASLPAFQVNGQFSQQRFQQVLYNSGMSVSQLITELQKEMLINQVANGIQQSDFILPSELQNYYELALQQRNFGFMIIPKQQFMSVLSVNDQQIEEYYKNNQQKFRLPEKISIAYIELSPQKISQGIAVSDAEVKQFYTDNRGNFQIPQSWEVEKISVPITSSTDSKQVETARKKMQTLLDDLKKGTSFAQLMKQNKGETTTIKAGRVTPAMKKLLDGLKVGQVSAPLYTPQGYVIVRLVKMTPQSLRPFDKVQDQIKKMLVHQQAQKELSSLNDKLSNLSFTNPDSLKPAAKNLGVSIETSPLFTHQGLKTGIASNPKVVSTAFSKDVLQEGNNSNPILLKNGNVVVLRVHQHQKTRIAPLKQVKQKVRDLLLGQMASAKGALLANQILEQINHGKTPSEIAKANHLTWVEQKAIKRQDKKISAAILSAAFNLAPEKTRNVTTVVLSNGDTAVVQLENIVKPSFATITDKEKDAFKSQLEKLFGQLNYALYVSAVKSDAKIKIMNKK